MSRHSTIGDKWTDGSQCERVPEGAVCLDAAGRDVGPFAFAETTSGLVGFMGDRVDNSRPMPRLDWKVCMAPLKIVPPA